MALEISRRIEPDQNTLSRVNHSLSVIQEVPNEKLLAAESKNTELLKEISKMREKIKNLENGSQFNLSADLSQIINSDISFIKSSDLQEMINPSDSRNEQHFKIEMLEHEIRDLKVENKSLIDQIRVLRTEIKHREDQPAESNLLAKLRSENAEIRILCEKLQSRLEKVTKEKKDLSTRLTGSKIGPSGSGDQIDKLQFKIKTLESTNFGLLKEIRELKTQNERFDNSCNSGGQDVSKLRQKIASLQNENERIKRSIISNAGEQSLPNGAEIEIIKKLKEKIRNLEARESLSSGDQTAVIEQLKQTNERLLNEVIRLSSLNQGGSMDQSMSMNGSLVSRSRNTGLDQSSMNGSIYFDN